MSQPLHLLSPAPYPATRMRRLRRNETLRSMVRETRLSPADLIQPLFVVEGSGRREKVASMPGVFRYSVDQVVLEARTTQGRGRRTGGGDAHLDRREEPLGVIPEPLHGERALHGTH